MRITVSGYELRLRFSNEFGDSPLTLDSVHIHQFTGIAMQARSGGSFWVSTFCGEHDHAPTKDSHASTSLQRKVTSRRESQRLRHYTRETSYLTLSHNASAESLTNPVTADHWYVLDGVEVRGKHATTAVVTLGDSITDGRGSFTNGDKRWPDYLARRLDDNKRFAKIGAEPGYRR